MFWKKPPQNLPPASGKPSRAELIAQAKAAVASAKEELGEETIAKMKAIMLAQQQQQQQRQAQAAKAPAAPPDVSPAERARELIKHMDKAKLADYIRATSREDD